ncbi:2,3,4,5-tetrahydropyridine-2,6-dicarboxylate N-succinyltransferase [Blochmannia endosymbiont of Camponotus modoc]|uniref:2,3,4,5-tetrahydropyridine-2,6-dicarboxylate N-succinyltransferase n=1 Tax=Blochmannia endosymbiont of Camponotus modoc TaxID=2945587 RepID=UPI002023D4BF|nr:2,3,4,5-tetrahydropyridine-2,6-dicarboxylate N-succinyltransferase [Blochmannia endosymbiont of Camponotus modoc]URJ32017.1 2,3,4,5-tetrahydropyridine-2,6-dicarboxylate N-succinyltransferase [Blochmannia endosymbiont of Camponotus modoc]
MNQLRKIIESAFEKKEYISNNNINSTVNNAVREIMDRLDNGTLRISEKINGTWITHQWLKKAIMLAFHTMDNQLITWGDGVFFDKFPMKFSGWDRTRFKNKKLRIIPPATVRYGAYIADNTVIMPSYINLGAYIDVGTMIDTWATVGSCAQIGKYVHLSGGVGIGGVLEPIQTNPTIIEDNCFIGSRSEIVEGVIVEKGAVISMGVFIGQSTKIYDRASGNIYYGRVPAGSVVIPGSLPSKDGRVNTYCAVIVKTVDSKTKNKVKINELLRDI